MAVSITSGPISCPCKKSSNNLGSILEPMVFGNSHIPHTARVSYTSNIQALRFEGQRFQVAALLPATPAWLIARVLRFGVELRQLRVPGLPGLPRAQPGRNRCCGRLLILFFWFRTSPPVLLLYGFQQQSWPREKPPRHPHHDYFSGATLFRGTCPLRQFCEQGHRDTRRWKRPEQPSPRG